MLVISDHVEFDSLYTCRNIGAQGLVFSYSGLAEIKRIANKLLSGGMHWPQIKEGLRSNEFAKSKHKTALAPKLTERQVEVLKYIQEGFTNRQISQCLNVTESTVKSHISVLLRKYNVSTRTKLVARL